MSGPGITRRRWLAAIGVTAIAGCSRETQFAPSNRRLIESLYTAISARNAEWLEENAKTVQSLAGEGKLDQAEREALEGIIALTRASDWKGAEGKINALRDGQRATSEDARAIQEAKPEESQPKLRAPRRG